MNNVNIYNQNGDPASLQVSFLGDVPEGDFSVVKGGSPVLIKNITLDQVEVQVKLKGMSNYVTTPLYPGWNPELIIAMKEVPSQTFQYGY